MHRRLGGWVQRVKVFKWCWKNFWRQSSSKRVEDPHPSLCSNVKGKKCRNSSSLVGFCRS